MKLVAVTLLGLCVGWLLPACSPKEDPKLRAAGHLQRSQGALGQGDLRGAATELQRALALDATLATYIHLAQVQATLGEFDGALRTLEQAEARYPGEYQVALEFGDVALGQGDLLQAEGYFQQAWELEPDQLDAVLRWAALQDSAGGCVRAERLIARVPEERRTAELALVQAELSKCIAKPLRWYALRREAQTRSLGHPGRAAVLARLYLAKEPPNWLAAERLLAQATRANYASSALHVLQASVLANLKRFEEAEQVLAKAKEIEFQRPVGALNTPEVKLLQAQVDLMQGSVERAARVLPTLVPQLDSERKGLAQAYLGKALIDSGNRAAGTAALLRLTSRDEGFAQAQLYLVDDLLAQGEQADALERLRMLLAYRPKFPAAYYRLARLLQAQGQRDEAFSVLSRGVVATPHDPQVWYELGHLELGGNLLRAEDCLEQALKLDPLFVPALVDLAGLMQRIGNTDNAIRLFEEALALDADNVELCMDLAALYAQQDTKLDRALTLAARASRLNPASARAEEVLGYVYYRRGEAEEARTHIEAALAAEPANPWLYYQHSLVLRAAGDAGAARRAQATARRLARGHTDGARVLEALRSGAR